MNKEPQIYKPASIDNPTVAPDTQPVQAQYKLDGGWYGASDYDPSEIGPNNFKTLINMRYGAKHPEGTAGYTVLNDTPISTYTNISSGIQLRTNRDNPSMVLVAANNGSGTGRLYQSTNTIPEAITLSEVTTGRSGGGAGTALSDTSGNTPRLAVLPQRHIAYSNEDASYIWAGPQMDAAAFFLCDDTNLANPRDYYKQIKNSLSSEYVTIAAASTDVFTVHSTRPLQGVWFAVASANATTSTLACHVWTASGWVAVSNPTDGTTVGGKAFAQSGEYVFNSTVSNATRKHFENTYFYCYRFQLSAGSANISHVQVDAPLQTIKDSWDGVPRNFQYVGINFSDKDEEFTAHVVEGSSTAVPIGMLLDGLTSSDEIYIQAADFEKLVGVQITMLADLVNVETATLSGYYWDGDSWAALPNFTDGTALSGATFGKSGLLSWNPPASEFPYTIGSKTGYTYKFVPSATLTGTHGDTTDSVVVDLATGIPAPRSLPPYRFHGRFKNRHLGCGAISEKEGNRIDFTAPMAVDVWNGLQSSGEWNVRSVYLDCDEDVTCGASLYNRYGSVDRLFEVFVVFTDSHTFQIKESTTDDKIFEDDKISTSVGCPAPATLVSANIGVESGPDLGKRNIILWCSSSGPYSYDGSYLDPIPGIEKYFDPNEDLYVGADLSSAYGWFDPTYREWNLVLPGDVWVVYDLEKRRWYQKDTYTAETPTCGWTVSDTNGGQYTYGGLNTGEVVRLEYGTTWDGVGITQEWESGDFWPSENIWHLVRIKYFKFIARAIEESHDVKVIFKADTEPGFSGTYVFYSDVYTQYDSDAYEALEPVVTTQNLSAGGANRIVRTTIRRNSLIWCCSFGSKVTTSDTSKGLQPIGWGIVWEPARDDK